MPHRPLVIRHILAAAAAALALLSGCASPGPPRAPSLQLPEPVSTLTAARIGASVTLRFTVPAITSDGQPLRGPVTATLCRAVAAGPCQPLPAWRNRPVTPQATAEWADPLPPDLLAAPFRPLTYRVELTNPRGRSAGPSEPATAAAGPAPPSVGSFRLEGSRDGVRLHWQPAPASLSTPEAVDEVLVERRSTAPPAQPAPRPKTPSLPAFPHKAAGPHPDSDATWLHTPSASAAPGMLDATATPGEPYLYTAVRRRTITLAGVQRELRSDPTPPAAFTLPAYAPPAPTGLLGAAFASPAAAQPPNPVVDLNWQPVNARDLAGYRVYRAELPANAAATEAPPETRLTPQPTPLPAFHDTAARPGTTYRYTVTAVDSAGRESPHSQPATVDVP